MCMPFALIALWSDLSLLQLYCDLGSSLSRLLDVTDDNFWRTGWVYIRAQHQIAFVYNGLFPSFSFQINLLVTFSAH